MILNVAKHPWCVATCAFLVTLAAQAQEQADQSLFTSDLLDAGGNVLRILIALSVVVVFLAVYFILTIRKQVLMPEKFRLEAEDIAERGDIEALYTVCNESNSAGARIIGAAARLLHENPHVDYVAVRDVVEGEGGRQSSDLWQRIQYIQDIAIIAPMLGLLGTVLGMLRAFLQMQESVGIGGIRQVDLAAGVSQALVTTAGGLVVGIAAMVVYSFFRGRVNRVVTLLEESCSVILQRFMFKSRGDAPAPQQSSPPPRGGLPQGRPVRQPNS